MWALSLWDETNLEGNNFWLFLLFSHEDWVQVALGKFSPRLEPAALEVKGRCANHFATEAPKNNSNAPIICFHHPLEGGQPWGDLTTNSQPGDGHLTTNCSLRDWQLTNSCVLDISACSATWGEQCYLATFFNLMLDVFQNKSRYF